MKRSSILFLIVLVILFLLTGAAGFRVYKKFTKKEKEAEEIKVSIPVHVAKVSKGRIEDIVNVTGFIEAADRVDVIAKIPMPGKLIAAKVKKGDQVKKGQVLALVDRDEVGAVYKPYAVEAPLSGIVAAITDDPGALITAQVPVAAVINIDQVKVKTSLIEADLARVQEGDKARLQVDAHPGEVFEGTVSRIEPVLDSISHTAGAEILVDNPEHKLLPGMFARIEIVADAKGSAVLIPKSAIFKRQGKDYAFVYNQKESRVYLTELKLGYQDQEKYEVREGVEPGDLVVDQDLVILKDRTLVSIANAEEVGLSKNQ